MKSPAFAQSIVPFKDSQYRYSICTLVTNPSEYDEMVESFFNAGFKPDFCEFLYCDNSQFNQLDAFVAYNVFLNSAKGKYIILCHQDILLKYDGIEKAGAVYSRIGFTRFQLGAAGKCGRNRIRFECNPDHTSQRPTKHWTLSGMGRVARREFHAGETVPPICAFHMTCMAFIFMGLISARLRHAWD